MKLSPKSISFPRLTFKRGILTLVGITLVGIVVLYLAATAFPSIGAQGSDTLRSLIGDQAVAQLETWIFQVQDSIHQTKYSLGLEKAASPWQSPDSPAPVQVVVPSATPTLSPTPEPSATPLPEATLVPTIPPTATSTPTPTLTPTPIPWRPAAAHALGFSGGGRYLAGVY